MKKLFTLLFLLVLPLQVFAADIATLTDNFNDNSIDAAKWQNDGGVQIVETNQELELTSKITAQNIDIYTKVTYDITNSQATIKIIDAGNQSLASWEFRFYVIDAAVTLFPMWSIKAGNIVAKNTVGGTIATASYVADTFRYLKIRESSSTSLLYFDYSADGISWTNFGSCAVGGLGPTAIYIDFGIVNGIELSTTTAKVDDFNILPSATRRIIFTQ